MCCFSYEELPQRSQDLAIGPEEWFRMWWYRCEEGEIKQGSRTYNIQQNRGLPSCLGQSPVRDGQKVRLESGHRDLQCQAYRTEHSVGSSGKAGGPPNSVFLDTG